MAFFPVLLWDPLNPGGDDCILGPGGPTLRFWRHQPLEASPRGRVEDPAEIRSFFFFGGGGVSFSNQEIGVHELSMGTLNYRKLYLSNCG